MVPFLEGRYGQAPVRVPTEELDLHGDLIADNAVAAGRYCAVDQEIESRTEKWAWRARRVSVRSECGGGSQCATGSGP